MLNYNCISSLNPAGLRGDREHNRKDLQNLRDKLADLDNALKRLSELSYRGGSRRMSTEEVKVETSTVSELGKIS